MTWEPDSRGTTNRNARGGSEDRRRWKLYLLDVFQADELLNGLPACRCFRCGRLLTFETITVDRIIPGAEGGTYARNNIRPACEGCNRLLGYQLQKARALARSSSKKPLASKAGASRGLSG